MTWKTLLNLTPMLALTGMAAEGAAPTPEDAAWEATYSAREAYYQKAVGPLPEDILKLPDFMGVWPGGGLYVIPAEKIGKGVFVYTTFGLSNVGMPIGARQEGAKTETDELGRVKDHSAALVAKQSAPAPEGSAGYGYELVVVARENAEWPLWVLQWALRAELNNDVGLLKRVEKYNGLTVQDIQVSANYDDVVHLLFSKAQAPLPAGTQLPNGRMTVLVATVITRDEMEWSMTHGRAELLDKLAKAGVGQVSARDRKSVLQ